MLEMMYMPAFDIEHMQKTIVRPLSMYEQKHDASTLKEVKDAIRISLMMVSGFRDILDDLNFDEKKLRTLQFNMDDNYESVEQVLQKSSDAETQIMIEDLLTQMAKLDMEIGDLILEHHHAS